MCQWFLDLIFCRTSSKTVETGFGSEDTKNFEKEALKAHNDYRALHGVPPLELSTDLCKFSNEWAQVLTHDNHFA